MVLARCHSFFTDRQLDKRIEHIKKTQKKKAEAIENGKTKVKDAAHTIADKLPTVGGGDSDDEDRGGEDDDDNWKKHILEGRLSPKKSETKDDLGIKAHKALNEDTTEIAANETSSGIVGDVENKGDAGAKFEVTGPKEPPVLSGAAKDEACPNPGESIAKAATAEPT